LSFKEAIQKYIKAGFLLLVLISILIIGYQNISYNWQWYRLGEYLFSFDNGNFTIGPLLNGLLITLKISSISLVFAIFIGFATAFGRLSPYPVLGFALACYVEIIRNTPLLIQIFVVYFVIAPVLDISPFTSAVLSLSFFEGAYAGEIIRSGIINVPKGQWEASKSLGLSTRMTYIKIIIPQAFRQVLPMLAGQSISLVKDSALVSTISIFDLTMQAQRIVSETFLTFEIWFTVAILYFSIAALLSFFVRLLEKKFKYAD